MSNGMAASQAEKRVLACVLCQQRKVKCDRLFPCSGCVRANVQCVPGSLVVRPRKPRFPEKQLLGRIQNYEALLREHNIHFEPLHSTSRHAKSQERPSQDECSTSSPSTSVEVKSEEVYEPKNFWHAMNGADRDIDGDSNSSSGDINELEIKEELHRGYLHNDHLLLGSFGATLDLSSLHPSPIHVFRLWQIYLENVDPLFKVTHSITTQARIIEAATNIDSISPALEALMFGIYCIAITSLNPNDCLAAFGASKDTLLTTYRLGCQHALSNARFLQSRDRDCLTALFLYLVSIGRTTHPQSVCSLCGVAMRIAQTMGIHTEASLARCTPFEAELRRRLWWALVLFDRRIAEVAGSMSVTYLAPTWDCKIPLNVNDSELRPEMSEPPKAMRVATEAIFAVVRAEFGEFIRHTGFQLDFTCPWLKPLARDTRHSQTPDGFVMPALEKMLEQDYLRLCDPKNSVHHMTIWMTRSQLATAHLIEYFSKHHEQDASRLTQAQRSTALSHALRTLSCNTRIMASPLNKKLRWLIQFYFPFPGYFHIVQELKRQPLGEQADKAWVIMAENYEAIFESFPLSITESPAFRVFAKLIFMAWGSREAAEVALTGELPAPPRMIPHIKEQLELLVQRQEQTAEGQPSGDATDINYLSMGMQASPANQGPVLSVGLQEAFQMPLDVDPSQLDWSAMRWN